jgi:Ras-related protein Rab-1A
MLVGNKSDLNSKRVVEITRGQELADNMKIPFVETSAKSAENVDKIFLSMARDIIRDR